MASDDRSELDNLALELLKLIHDMISWQNVIGDKRELGREKWRILAKRVMASSGDDIQEFIHNVIKSVSGDAFYITRTRERKTRFLGKELDDFLKKIKDRDLEKRLLSYIRSRAIPLVVRLSVIVPEREGEGE